MGEVSHNRGEINGVEIIEAATEGEYQQEVQDITSYYAKVIASIVISQENDEVFLELKAGMGNRAAKLIMKTYILGEGRISLRKVGMIAAKIYMKHGFFGLSIFHAVIEESPDALFEDADEMLDGIGYAMEMHN